MDKLEHLKVIAKRQGITNVAKVILENDDIAKAISEEEFVAMLTEAAREYQREHESPTQAFAHMFSAPTPEGLLLRQAHACIKMANRATMPTDAPIRKSESSAYEKLMEKAELLQKVDPDLSLDQAFAKVFTNPANRELAEQERRENRPVSTTYPEKGERQ